MIKPVDPFQRREFDGFKTSPGSASMNEVGLAKPVDGFGEGIVTGIARAFDGGVDTGRRHEWAKSPKGSPLVQPYAAPREALRKP